MKYEGFAESCIGSSHVKKNTVCQDFSQYLQDNDTVSAAVADGHGSRQYFRSEKGAKFAAEIAVRKLNEFLNDSVRNASETPDEKEIERLIKSIITEWKITVREDILRCPFTEEELSYVTETNIAYYTKFSVKNNSGETKFELSELLQTKLHEVFTAYGTTLICVGICSSYALGLHIGDGKCVALYDDGTTDEPIPWDERCHLNICTSICDKDSADEFRFYVWKDKLPAAIYMGTDGMDDTFADRLHSFYLQTSLDLIKPDLRSRVRELAEQLPKISEIGSKDDISIAGIVNVDALRSMESIIKKKAAKELNKTKISELERKRTELDFRLKKAQRILLSTPETDKDKYNKYLSKTEELKLLLSEIEEEITKLTDDETVGEETEE